jgi:hypothetical protein
MTRSSTAMITALLSTSHSRNLSNGPASRAAALDIGDASVRRLGIGELEVDELRMRRLHVLERNDGS